MGTSSQTVPYSPRHSCWSAVHESVLVEVIVTGSDGVEHHLLVVAPQAGNVLRVGGLKLPKGGDHLRAVRTPVM